MRALTATDLLGTSEALRDQSPLEQALTILHAALPEVGREALANLTVSERDARLLELREQTLGVVLEGRADCPCCKANLEFAVRTADLSRPGAAFAGQHSFVKEDWRLQLRMPTSRDLFEVVDLPLEEGRRVLAQRCIVKIERGEEQPASNALPDDLIEEAGKQLCESERAAEFPVNLACPACGHRWEMTLDIAAFFANEIETIARRLLFEVHALATAYGWSEREVLTLSARRRHAYLELVGYA